jgi:hypothetical protein
MGDNKKTRIKLEGWLEHIVIHERKIAEELAKPEPNMGLVVHLYRIQKDNLQTKSAKRLSF